MLTVDKILKHYKTGCFPMAEDCGDIVFHFPCVRAIFPIYEVKHSRSLIKFIQKNSPEVTFNADFHFVITQCAARESTWISPEIIEIYYNLHLAGFAHSIEVWHEDMIVGGLYGVAIGGAFFGESMFNLLPNMAKVAFYHLIERLKLRDFTLLDSQYINDFTRQLGAIEIYYKEYLRILKNATQLSRVFP